MKRTALKPGRHVTYGTPDERYEFRLAIVGKPCVVCGRYELEARVITGYGHQAHHAIEQQTLKRMSLTEHLWDVRNAVPVCEEPCHRQATSRKRPLTWDELPAAAKDFADALNLLPILERMYPTAKEEA